MRPRIRTILLLAFLISASAMGWTHLHGAPVPAYKSALVDRGDIESTIAATGACNAVVTVQVGSQVSGNIKALYADFNTAVHKGQLVALIDPESFQARVNQASASLDSARDGVLNAEAAAKKAEADLSSAKAGSANANAELAKARVGASDADIKLKRQQESFGYGLIARDDLDTAQATSDAAQASVEAAQAQLNAANDSVAAANAQLNVSHAEIQAMEAQVRQAEASLAQAQVDLNHTEIRAPLDGTVVARHMDVGQTVAASFQAPTIFDIAQDLTKMQVDANVDEADVGRVRVGQTATFTVDAYPSDVFTARVAQIRQAPINNQNVITYDVVITADNTQLKLFPGMTANVRILTDELRNVLRVPNAAFRFKPSNADSRQKGTGQTVYLIGNDRNPLPAPIKVGITDGTYTAVLDGLHEADQVIVGPQNSEAAAARATTGQRGPSF